MADYTGVLLVFPQSSAWLNTQIKNNVLARYIWIWDQFILLTFIDNTLQKSVLLEKIS